MTNNPIRSHTCSHCGTTGKPVQWASSARNRAVNKVLRSIPANHQFMMVDLGEMK
jgi:hypothetical protein